jgi:hypothetical protein
MVMLHKIPPEKNEEYNEFPLASQIGFIHAMPEDDFDIATATITDVGFLGLFPKQIYQTLLHYSREMERCSATFGKEIMKLIDNIIATFVNRPVTMQKVINILLAQYKNQLAKTEREDEISNADENGNEILKTIDSQETSEETIKDNNLQSPVVR